MCLLGTDGKRILSLEDPAVQLSSPASPLKDGELHPAQWTCRCLGTLLELLRQTDPISSFLGQDG